MRLQADFYVGDDDNSSDFSNAETVRAAMTTIVDKIDWGVTSGAVRDVNGNVVGHWELYGLPSGVD